MCTFDVVATKPRQKNYACLPDHNPEVEGDHHTPSLAPGTLHPVIGEVKKEEQAQILLSVLLSFRCAD